MRRAVSARGLAAGVVVVGLLGAGAVWRPVTGMAEPPGMQWNVRVVDAAGHLGTSPAVTRQTRGERLLKESTGLLESASSVRMVADVKQGARHVRSDLRMDKDGNCTGTLDGGPGMRGQLVVLAGPQPEAYMKFTDASLAELRAMAESRGPEVAARVRERSLLARGKYVKAPAGEKGAGAIAQQCRIGQVMGAARGTAGTRALPAVRRDGRRVIPLVPPSGEDDQGTAYVAADGKPYLLALKGSSSGMAVDIAFSGYGDPLRVRRPDAAQIARLPQDDGSLFAA